MAKNPPEKVKVQVRVCQTFTFTVTWQELFLCVAGCDFDFHFLVGILQSSVNLVIFSLLGGTSSILKTFLAGTSQKRHPVAKQDRFVGAGEWRPNTFGRVMSRVIWRKVHQQKRPSQAVTTWCNCKQLFQSCD